MTIKTLAKKHLHISVGDWIQIHGSDGHYTVEVTSDVNGRPVVVDHQRYPYPHPLYESELARTVAVFTPKIVGRRAHGR